MLVLSRKIGEEILIGDNVRLVVYRIHGNRVQLGIRAPAGVPIYRTELLAQSGERQREPLVHKAR